MALYLIGTSDGTVREVVAPDDFGPSMTAAIQTDRRTVSLKQPGDTEIVFAIRHIVVFEKLDEATLAARNADVEAIRLVAEDLSHGTHDGDAAMSAKLYAAIGGR